MTPEVFQWAARNGVSMQALHELQTLVGLHGGHAMPDAATGTSEAAAAAVVRLEAARKGVKLFRNNVGVLPDLTGRPVRYGLANESKQINERIKSSDYMGWRARLITPQDVGTVIGQAVGREVKKVGWRYTGTGREPAQLAWVMMGLMDGCDFGFATGEGTL